MPMVRSESDGSIRQANAFLEDLQKLDAVSEDETRNDLQRCSVDQEKTRQAPEELQGQFTAASKDETRRDLQRCSVDQEKTRQELETLQEKFTTASTDLESCKEKLSHVEPQLEQCRNSLGETQEELRKSADAHKQVQKRLDAMIADRDKLAARLQKAEGQHTEVGRKLSDAKEQLDEKQLYVDQLQRELDQQRKELNGKLQDTEKKLHKKEEEARARISADVHNVVQERLDAVTILRHELAGKLARAEVDAQRRPTEVEHRMLQLQVADLKSELGKRPTCLEHKTVKRSLESAEYWSKYWEDKCTETLARQPSPAEERPWEKEHLQKEIAAQKELIKQLNVSLDETRDERSQLDNEVARMHDEAMQTSTKHLQSVGERRQEAATLRSALRTSQNLAQSTKEELERTQQQVAVLEGRTAASNDRVTGLLSSWDDDNQAQEARRQVEQMREEAQVAKTQLADSRNDVENLNTLFRQLTESVCLSEELYKSCVWGAEAERDQTKQDYASLKRQHNQQGHDYGCLKVVHADTVADLQAKMREAELADQKIEMYKQARSEVLQFLYRSVMLRPDAFADDEASSVLEITRRRLRDCKDAKDRIDSVHTAISDRLDVACVRLDRCEQTSSERLETARSLISTRNRQISMLKKLVTTQESAHRTALQERNQLALALRDTSARYNELVQFVERMSLK
jgi:chromosome segregation ATPase